MTQPDLLDAIYAALTQAPTVLAQVEPILQQMRQTYGGDTVYIRTPARRPTTRTLQRHRREYKSND